MSVRVCVEPDCDEPAGTPWGPYWCPKHDRERLDRISANLDAMSESMASGSIGEAGELRA